MTPIEILTAYRSVAHELRMQHTLQDRLQGSLSLHRASKSTMTKLSRSIARFDRLITATEARQEAMQPDYDRVMTSIPDEHARIILQQYYGMAMTDAEIADLMNCDTRTVNRHRNQCLRSLADDMPA